VCHGGVINAYVAHLLGTHRSIWMMVENTSITTVSIADTATIVTLNDCQHLYDIVTHRA
jgi:broad specificity phosphatase PhoE